MTDANDNKDLSIKDILEDFPISVIKHPCVQGFLSHTTTNPNDNKDLSIKYTEEGIPIIKFMNHPCLGGFFWSGPVPFEYGGSGIPIPEHKEVYDECKKNGTKFYWITD